MKSSVIALLFAIFTHLCLGAPVFPLKASRDGRYLIDASGHPFFFHGDTAWALPKKATIEDAKAYFELRAKDGFTAIHLHTVSKEVGPSKNVNGDEPFTPLDNILQPNEAYWRHLDAIVEAAEQRGLLVALSALWIRWGGRDREGWRAQLTETNATAFGEFLGRRFATRKNLLWILGGDDNPHEDRGAIVLMGKALKASAPHHLITVHNQPEHSSAAFFGNEPWLDVNAAYTYREVPPHVLAEWNRPFNSGKPLPIYLIESGYEHESNDQRAGSAHRVRRQAYGAILNGALMGHAYGHREVWRFSDKWREGIKDTGSMNMRHLLTLFSTRQWWKLVPDQLHDLVPSRIERVSPGEVSHASSARAGDGSFGVVYLPEGKPIVINPRALAGAMKASWYDPTDGSIKPASGAPWRDTGWLEFSAPKPNAAGDPDFALLLESATPSR